MKGVDPAEHGVASAVAVYFIAADIYAISHNGLNREHGLALAADVAGLALPVVTGGGAIVRTALRADDAVDALKTADNATDATRSVTNGLCSFSADTPVVTPDGAVPIAAIDIGDTVLAYHEATGETGVYTVTDTIAHVDPLVVLITRDTDDLETTPEHPFFTRTPGWVAARHLTPGAEVRRLDGGYGVVTRVVLAVRVQPMYNLTVATAHTFFVGDDGWLVHNCGGGKSISTQIPAKKVNQMANRKWTQDAIDEVVNNPFTTRTSTNKATGNTATVYYRQDGHYVVRDDVTGQLVQGSDMRYPGHEWIPDSDIINPYRPE
ncbi:MAG: hypothetical protein MI924_17805 [Chloroflexales bacterium]|nr:hypothetical protein [Chloroflexales bacterium]